MSNFVIITEDDEGNISLFGKAVSENLHDALKEVDSLNEQMNTNIYKLLGPAMEPNTVVCSSSDISFQVHLDGKEYDCHATSFSHSYSHSNFPTLRLNFTGYQKFS